MIGIGRGLMYSASGTPCKLRTWTSARRVGSLEKYMLSAVKSSRAISTDLVSVSSINQSRENELMLEPRSYSGCSDPSKHL